MKRLLSFFFVFTILVSFVACEQPGINGVDTPVTLEKKNTTDKVVDTTPIVYEMLESEWDITSNNIIVNITDEFNYVRSHDFYVHLNYPEYSNVVSLGQYVGMSFVIEELGVNNLNGVSIYAIVGD